MTVLVYLDFPMFIRKDLKQAKVSKQTEFKAGILKILVSSRGDIINVMQRILFRSSEANCHWLQNRYFEVKFNNTVYLPAFSLDQFCPCVPLVPFSQLRPPYQLHLVEIAVFAELQIDLAEAVSYLHC